MEGVGNMSGRGVCRGCGEHEREMEGVRTWRGCVEWGCEEHERMCTHGGDVGT